MSLPSPRLPVFYAAYFANTWLRRIVTYVAVVYSFTALGGGTWAGIFYLCLVLPYLFSVYAGSVIDATAKRRVLHVTAAAAVVLLALAGWADHARWLGNGTGHGVLMAALISAYGVVSAFAYPAFFAAIPEVVSRERVGHTTIVTNVLGMLCYACGPLAAGALQARLGWPAVFAGLAALGVGAWALVGLAALPAAAAAPAPAGSEWARFRELLAYCRTHGRMTTLLVAVGLFAGLVVGPLEVLAPLYAQAPLRLDAFAAGLFVATGGVGLVLGAAGAIRLVDRVPLVPWLCGCGMAGGALLGLLTFLPAGPAFAAVFVAGGLGGIFNSLSVAGMVAGAPDALRGRVLGLYSLILGATPALGGLISGTLVDACGTPVTMRLVFGTVVVAFALLLFWRHSRAEESKAIDPV